MPTVQTSNGQWTTDVYEPVMTPYTPGEAVQAGANIKLSFTPAISLPSTANIRLVQFKNPISPPGWAVDRGNGRLLPWFGWDDQDTPIKTQNIGLMPSLASEKANAQKGSVTTDKRTVPAFLIDTPREPTRVPAAGSQITALYTTFAFDVTNAHWLGGVSWGYILSMPAGANAHPVISLRELSLRTKASPAGHVPAVGGVAPVEEALAAQAWNASLATTHGRIAVPNW